MTVWTVLMMIAMGIGGSAGADTGPPFHELMRIKPGGEGGWDYLKVDAGARRLYVARATRIMVLDADSGKTVGEVSGLDGAHGIAWVTDLNRGFATSGKSGEVFAFDLKTLEVSERIKVGANPDAIVYDAGSRRILAFNGKGQSASVIDPATRKVTGTVALPGKPEFAVADGAGRVFVNIEDQSELLELDPVKLKVVATHALHPCEEPTGLAIDVSTKSLIVGCDNQLMAIVDADSGKVRQTFKAGDGVDATAFDSGKKLAFASAGEGSLTVLSETGSEFKLLQNVPTAHGARTMAVDEKTGRIFLPTAKFEPIRPGSPAHTRAVLVPGSFEIMVMGRD